jgi:ABC-2 type transport system permease protein
MTETSTLRFWTYWRASVFVLWKRDIVRFFRQRSRVVGAALQPLILWLVIGSGMSGSFRIPGAPQLGYLEYFYPGVLVMVVLFTSIFATSSLIEDRQQGFMQAMLVGPATPSAIVVGKTLGGCTVALIQAGLFLLFAPWVGFPWLHVDWPALALSLLLVSVALNSLGFTLAWLLNSIQGYLALMNVVLIPMWVLSGAMFPGTGGWMLWAMKLNPVSYAVTAVRRALYGGTLPHGVGLPGVTRWQELAVVAGFCALSLTLATTAARRRAQSK